MTLLTTTTTAPRCKERISTLPEKQKTQLREYKSALDELLRLVGGPWEDKVDREEGVEEMAELERRVLFLKSRMKECRRLMGWRNLDSEV